MGSGYARVCDENGVWSETMEGECSCPAEVVHHSDGNVYLMEEVVAGEVVSQMCGANMTGMISRSCSLYGGWSAIRGECKRIQCPEEQLNGYAWPATNSSTEVRLPCSESMTGYVSRTCGATGVWGEPEDSCRTQMCDPVTINRMSNGCMNLKFEPEAAPYVRVNVVPSSSPDLSMVFRGRTVRICGLEVKVAYSMFVEYCTDASTTEC